MIKQSNVKLPINIKLNYPEDQISTKDFYDIIDGAVVYRGTSGLELLYQKKNIITCGIQHYGFHGFTRDALTKRGLKNLIKMAHTIKPLSDCNYQKIQRYCYSFFISKQIEFKIMNDKYSDFYNLNHFKIPWYFLFKNEELNIILKSIEKNKELDEVNTIPEEVFSNEKLIDIEDVLELWNEYTEEQEKKGRYNIASILRISKPTLKDNCIYYEVSNNTSSLEIESEKHQLIQLNYHYAF